MRASVKTGFTFGLTSGVITTLGLMVGLHAGTHSKAVVLGGILTIAVADSLSDAMGIHLSEESKNTGSAHHIWESTLATFIAKLVIALSFVVPVLVAPLSTAIVLSVLWGLFLMATLSFFLARTQQIAPWKVIGEHLLIALCVVTLSHYVGDWIQTWKG
jgi:VIT1/CCC1 family predicted Fe2+/Mn2+ transporter